MQIIERQKTKTVTLHLFTDGNGFFQVTQGNKIVHEDKPNTAYRVLVDTRFFSKGEFSPTALANWVLDLQEQNIIREDFTA